MVSVRKHTVETLYVKRDIGATAHVKPSGPSFLPNVKDVDIFAVVSTSVVKHGVTFVLNSDEHLGLETSNLETHKSTATLSSRFPPKATARPDSATRFCRLRRIWPADRARCRIRACAL
jgi:hypothetical protein